MEINQILTVTKARGLIKEENEKRDVFILKELNKLRLKIIDLEAVTRGL